MDLVADDLVIGRARLWHLPVQLFHRLNAIDVAGRYAGNGDLIEAVQFIPSGKRMLAYRMQLLTKQEIRAMNAVLRGGPASLDTHLKAFSDDRKTVISDSLLAYHKYRFMSRGSVDDQSLQELKRRVLLARLKLPAQPRLAPDIPVLPSPADGSRPMAAGVGVASSTVNEAPFLRLTWSPFRLERVGRNSMEGGELVLLDVAVGLLEDQREIFLDQFDLIRISSLNTLPLPVAGENPLSWQLRVGAVRVDNGEKPVYDGAASFGIGYAKSLRSGTIGYAMVDAAVHTLTPHVRLRPHLGLNTHLAGLRTWAYAGVESVDYHGDFGVVWGGKFQLSLTKRVAIHAEFSNERATRTTIGVELNW